MATGEEIKIKKIIDLCKQNKFFGFGYSEDGTQVLTDGVASYILPGTVPTLNEGVISALYSLKEKLVNESTFTEFVPKSEYINDTFKEEQKITPLGLEIIYKGYTIMPFSTETGVKYIQSKYLYPINEEFCNLTFTLRNNKYIAVKKGMLLTAVITEYDANKESAFIKTVNQLYV